MVVYLAHEIDNRLVYLPFSHSQGVEARTWGASESLGATSPIVGHVPMLMVRGYHPVNTSRILLFATRIRTCLYFLPLLSSMDATHSSPEGSYEHTTLGCFCHPTTHSVSLNARITC